MVYFIIWHGVFEHSMWAAHNIASKMTAVLSDSLWATHYELETDSLQTDYLIAPAFINNSDSNGKENKECVCPEKTEMNYS